MKATFLSILLLATSISHAETIISPDGKIKAEVTITGGQPFYSVTYNGKTFLEPSIFIKVIGF